ncbi:penicillin-binding protein 1A [Marinomonas agarivorans]|nr:penicillin-binding protein 1A [Marinomonas agarivorans]
MAKFFKIVFILGLLAALASFGLGFAFYQSVKDKIPTVEQIRFSELQVPLRIYTKDGKLIEEFGEKRRAPISYEDIPPLLEAAVLAAEDNDFYSHPGVDIKGLMRSVLQIAKTGRIVGGGSTITMQVARNYFLSFEQTFSRKFTEILIALTIEQELSKEEIFELYVNKIFLGKSSYGFQAAAQIYYNTTLDNLSLAQLAMLAGMPKAPSSYNPVNNPSRAIIRRNWILQRMLFLGKIDKDSYEEAVGTSITAKNYGIQAEVQADYVAEMVRAELYDTFGDALYEEGMSVYTTIDSRLQQSANESVLLGLSTYDERHGYRGSLETRPDLIEAPLNDQLQELRKYSNVGHWQSALVLSTEEDKAAIRLDNGERHELLWDGMKWAKPYIDNDTQGEAPTTVADILVKGDIIHVKPDNKVGWKLSQLPIAQSALISLNSKNGAIEALVGGFNFKRNKFNRVTQSKRQPGSNFKPFIYTSAIAAGYSAASIINDAPVVFNDDNLATAWRPTNDSGKFYGPTRLRQALYRSQNIVSVRLLDEMGVGPTLEYLRRFGFDPEELPKNLSLSLGSANLSPLQVATGYAVLSNGGYQIKPFIIDRVVDRSGSELYRSTPITVCTTCTILENEFGEEEETRNSLPNALFNTDTGIRTLPVAPQVIEPEVSYIVYDMLRDVIKFGTGRRARVLKRDDIAGKTGTTNDVRDAWFSGFNGDVVTTVWSGFDDTQPLGRGEWGGSVSLPIWINYMRESLKDRPLSYVYKPSSLVAVKIDPETGDRATPGQKDAVFEIFRKENIPEIKQQPIAPAINENSDTNNDNASETVNSDTLENLF